MKLYIASSWRNPHYPSVVVALRACGFECYDFRNPTPDDPDDHVFHWTEVDPNWKDWTAPGWINQLSHPIAEEDFAKNMAGMESADACVIVYPCGRSAHLEAGWFAGQGKPVIAYIPPETYDDPDLMVKMFHGFAFDLDGIVDALHAIESMS